MFLSKFVFLAAIAVVFQGSVEISGFVGLLVIIACMTIAQRLVEFVDDKLGWSAADSRTVRRAMIRLTAAIAVARSRRRLPGTGSCWPGVACDSGDGRLAILGRIATTISSMNAAFSSSVSQSENCR